MKKPINENPPGNACRVCERTTFQNPPVCLGCSAILANVRKGNADRILEHCLRTLEIPLDLEVARVVLDTVQSKAAPHRLADPNRHRALRKCPD